MIECTTIGHLYNSTTSDLQDRLTDKLQGLEEAKARKQAKTDAKSGANSFIATSQEAENLGGHKAAKAVTIGSVGVHLSSSFS